MLDHGSDQCAQFPGLYPAVISADGLIHLVYGQRCRSRDKMKEPTMNATEPVYMELVDFVARGSTAEEVANFRPSPEAQQRVAELLERQRESKLTEQENAELDGFVQLEHMLGLAKAKAQLILAGRS
jgi:hypothetical protein